MPIRLTSELVAIGRVRHCMWRYSIHRGLPLPNLELQIISGSDYRVRPQEDLYLTYNVFFNIIGERHTAVEDMSGSQFVVGEVPVAQIIGHLGRAKWHPITFTSELKFMFRGREYPLTIIEQPEGMLQ